MARPRKTNVEHLHNLLHVEFTKILSDLNFTDSRRSAYVKCWWNGDLIELRRTCKKIINIVESIRRENYEIEKAKMAEYFDRVDRERERKNQDV